MYTITPHGKLACPELLQLISYSAAPRKLETLLFKKSRKAPSIRLRAVKMVSKLGFNPRPIR